MAGHGVMGARSPTTHTSARHGVRRAHTARIARTDAPLVCAHLVGGVGAGGGRARRRGGGTSTINSTIVTNTIPRGFPRGGVVPAAAGWQGRARRILLPTS